MKQTLSGTRIRALRTARKLAQAELAERAGVSASYLNLIEHNRRRASPRVLRALALALDLAPEALAEDAEDEVLAILRDAAAQSGAEIPPEVERAEEFQGRFPGWAALVVSLLQRVDTQERTINRLSDRMAHDPNMSAALHEIVSAVTSVQSTAAILVEGGDMPEDWRRRFLGNVHDDAVRLANAAEALVAYLDTSAEESGLAAPLEELESWLERHDFHLPEIEADAPVDWVRLTRAEPELASGASRQMARDWIERAQRDARSLPLAPLLERLRPMFDGSDPEGFAPDALARAFGTDLATVMRRLATLPAEAGMPRFGLVICDGSGTPVFRRPVEGFAFPRFGGACPLWPLFQALMQPGQPIRRVIDMAGRPPARFLVHGIAQPDGIPGFGAPPVWMSAMLITPTAVLSEASLPEGAALPVGSSCRVCPRTACQARREPTIVQG